MMDFIRTFWIDMFPQFQNGFEFVYVFLEVASFCVMITIMFEVPSRLLLGKKGGFFKWD